jgi:intein-encoded DNA endonuclease-like protein
MLNEFVNKKSSMGMILKNPEEMEKLKRKLIAEYCHRFTVRASQYSLRAQIIAYYNSILGLLEQFPSIR